MKPNIEFDNSQVDRLGRWLSEWLGDSAPLNELRWHGLAESMVKSPTFQEIVREIRNDGGEMVPKYKLHAVTSVLADREKELLRLKGPCSTDACVLHYAHSGPCDCP